MILKHIFKHKQTIFREILDKKVSNQKLYEKSYLRKRYENSNVNYILDNSKVFSPLIKTKTKKKVRRIIEESNKKVVKAELRMINANSFKANAYKIHSKLKVNDLVENVTGSSVYSTNFIYRSRRNASLRFQVPAVKTHKLTNLSNLFLDSLKSLSTGRIKEKETDENTLILLHSERGGYNCYSCGFRGFLSGYQFDCVCDDWHDTFFSRENTTKFFQLRSFFSLRKIEYMISPPTRFMFEIKAVTQEFRFRKKKLLSSRKKRNYNLNRLIPIFVFKSVNS